MGPPKRQVAWPARMKIRMPGIASAVNDEPDALERVIVPRAEIDRLAATLAGVVLEPGAATLDAPSELASDEQVMSERMDRSAEGGNLLEASDDSTVLAPRLAPRTAFRSVLVNELQRAPGGEVERSDPRRVANAALERGHPRCDEFAVTAARRAVGPLPHRWLRASRRADWRSAMV